MKQRKHQILFPVASMALSLILAAIAIELTFVAASRLKEGRFVSTSDLINREVNSVQVDAQFKMKIQGEDCNWAELFRPHPTYLYVKKNRPPCADLGINADGFRGPLAPLKKDPKVFTILFGGGSVAEDLVGTEEVTTLETELNAKFRVPGFDRIQVINAAIAGWRQPQTFIAFAMNSHRIDAFVTLEGYNEHYLMIETPNGRPFGSLVNPFAMRGVDSITDTKGAVSGVLEGFLFAWLREDGLLQKSHTVYFFTDRLRNKLRDIHQQSRRDETGLHNLASSGGELSRTETFRYNLERYKHTLRQTNAIASRFKIRTLHFLQPVPAEKRNLTAREVEVVGDLSYRKDYQVQTDELLELTKEEINIVSLHDLFKDTSEDIFNDRIHLNLSGREAVIQKIVSDIGRRWKLEAK